MTQHIFSEITYWHMQYHVFCVQNQHMDTWHNSKGHGLSTVKALSPCGPSHLDISYHSHDIKG